jgi:hypothetical protein
MAIMDDIRRMMAERAAQGIGTGGGIFGNTNQQGQPMGLLGGMQNINPNLLIGASIAGSGLQGKDPFSSILPAVTQTAALSKYLTPKDTRTPLQKNLEAAGLKPGTPEYQEALLKATKKQPLIQQTGENAFTKRMGEIYGDEFKGILESSNVAIDNQSIISSARSLLNQEDLKTGIDAPLRTTAQRVANALGIDVNLQNVSAAQLLQQSTGDLVLNDLGKFKGAISDGERKFAIDKNVNLGQTKEGIAIRLELMERAGDINLKYAEAAEDWVQRNKALQEKDVATGQTWTSFKKQFRKENPLIDEDFKKRIDNAVKEQPDFALQGNIKVIDGKTYYKYSDGSWNTEPEKR